jgi:subtilisin family serine protease
MKKLLYWGVGLALIATLFYNNLGSIANWWLGEKTPQTIEKELPYVKNQYVITFPTQLDSAMALKKRLGLQGFSRVAGCSCSDRVEVWRGLDGVKLFPETDPPDTMAFRLNYGERIFDKQNVFGKQGIITKIPVPKTKILQLEGYTVTRNYKLSSKYPTEKVARPSLPIATFDYPNLTSPEVTVAIVDTGVDTLTNGLSPYLFRNSVPALVCNDMYKEGILGLNMLNPTMTPNLLEPIDVDGRYIYKWPFTYYRHGHGTLINGIIAGLAQYPNRPNIAKGIGVRLKLLNVKFVEQRAFYENPIPEGTLFDALCGVEYALKKGAQVINISWGVNPLPENRGSVRNAFLGTLTNVYNANAILVAAAGNDGSKNTGNLEVYPASFSQDPIFKDNIISVGAWVPDSSKAASFSNEADFIDVYAPGRGITLQSPWSGWWNCFKLYTPQSGTSFAVPFVVREVAMLKANSALSPAQIKQTIVSRSPASTAFPRNKVFTPSQ